MWHFFLSLSRELISSKWNLLATGLFSVVSTVLLLTYPAFAAQLVNNLNDGGDEGWFLLNVAAWITVIILQAICSLISICCGAQAGEEVSLQLRARSFAACQYRKFDAELSTGDALARVTHDTALVGYFVSHGLPQGLILLLTALGAWVFLATEHLNLALTLSLFYICVGAYLYRCTKLIKQRANSVFAANSEFYDLVDENLTVQTVVKTSFVQQSEISRFNPVNQNLKSLSLKYHRLQMLLSPVARASGLILALALLILFVNSSTELPSTAQLTKLLFYVFFIVRPIGALAGLAGQMAQARVGMSRIEQLLNCNTMEIVGDYQNYVQPTCQYQSNNSDELKISNLCFAYQGSSALYESIDMLIPSGRISILQGANGSGKSTLGYLLMRLIEPHSGSIELGQQNAADIPLDQWRRQMGYLPQQPYLRNFSLAENIDLGRGFEHSEIEAALAEVGANQLVGELPGGLSAKLGQRGGKISGGQRQLVALARAVVGNPKFLILDEPSTGLDRHRLDSFLANRERWSNAAGILIITHENRFSDIADHCYQLEDGKLYVN